MPIRLALINDHPLVVDGLRALLADRPEIEVVEMTTLVDVDHTADIALMDMFGQALRLDEAIQDRLSEPTIHRVALYSWNVDDDMVRDALGAGASGVLSKTLGAGELVDALRRINAGEQVVDRGDSETKPDDIPATTPARGRDWPGREHGLSMREAEMITLICQGLSNDQICERLYLSVNSVKTYIRTAYAKIGVQSRSQAVIWGLDHGMRPQASRRSA